MLGASVRDDSGGAERAVAELTGTNGVVNALVSSGIMDSEHAAVALEAVLDLAVKPGGVKPGGVKPGGVKPGGAKPGAMPGVPPAGTLPVAATAVLRLLPRLRHLNDVARLLGPVEAMANRSEADAICLAEAGALAAVLELLSTFMEGIGGAAETGQLRRSLVRLAVALGRAWSGPDALRTMLRAARGSDSAGEDGVLSLRWLALLVTMSLPRGPAMPYVSLGPPAEMLAGDVLERAWPPAHAYSVCVWVRRPAATASSGGAAGGPGGLSRGTETGGSEGGGSDLADGSTSRVDAANETQWFALFEFETADQRSYTAGLLRMVDAANAELCLKTGSSLKTASKRLTLPLSAGRWHHVCAVHERHRPLASSQLTLYLDGTELFSGSLAYPAFDCCHTLVARLGYVAPRGAGADSTDDKVRADPSRSNVGWHLGPCFAAEVKLSEAQVRDACAMGLSPPWVQLHEGEAQSDELRSEARTCWLQSSLSAGTFGGGGAAEGGELGVGLSKMIFTTNGHADEAAGLWHQHRPLRPRYLVQSLSAAGGPAALLTLVQRARDPTSLVLALRLVCHFLVAEPFNLRLFVDEHADFGLRFLLRAKPTGLLSNVVCDAILDLCCKQHALTSAASRAFESAIDRLTTAGGPTEATVDAADVDELAEQMLSLHLSQTHGHPPLLANQRLLTVLLLDDTLWAAALPARQRHWLQRLHGLLTEDAVGEWNASCLVDAGLLDSLMVMLSSGALTDKDNRLLAARLVLRTWHSVEFSKETSRRVHDFLVITASSEHSDLQLLCLRMLSRMLAHARTTLEEEAEAEGRSTTVRKSAQSEGRPDALGLHQGARAILAVLQPALLFAFLQPEPVCPAGAPAIALRLIVSLLLLSNRFPQVGFGRTFAEGHGFEKLEALLPLHASQPDVYLALVALAAGRELGTVERNPPPESAPSLQASCTALLAAHLAERQAAAHAGRQGPGGRGEGSWEEARLGGSMVELATASLRMIARIVHDRLMPTPSPADAATPPAAPTASASPTAAPAPTAAPSAALIHSAAPAPASALAPSSAPALSSSDAGLRVGAVGADASVDVPLVLLSAVLPSVRALMLQKPLLESLLQPTQSELLCQLCSVLGSAWLCGAGPRASLFSSCGEPAPSRPTGPSATATTTATSHAREAASREALSTLVSLLAAAMLEGPALLTSSNGQAALDMLLNPLPSTVRSSLLLDAWTRLQCELLRSLLPLLHAGLGDRNAALTEHHTKAFLLLFHRLVRLQALLVHPTTRMAAGGLAARRPSGEEDEPSVGSDAASTSAVASGFPHQEVLAVALLLAERGVGTDSSSVLRSARETSAAAAEKVPAL